MTGINLFMCIITPLCLVSVARGRNELRPLQVFAIGLRLLFADNHFIHPFTLFRDNPCIFRYNDHATLFIPVGGEHAVRGFISYAQ